MARIGLVAGQGDLPIVFSKRAKEKGDTVIAFALKGVTAEELSRHVDKIHWLEWGALQKALLLLATERIAKVVMLGKLNKGLFFREEDKLDAKAKELLGRIKDKKDYALLNEAAGFLKKIGIEIIDPTAYLKDLIPHKGTLTKREPTDDEWADINYGREIAKAISGFDVGQTVAVKEKAVIALEAMEGTNETISRAGAIVKKGFVMVKVARPSQDMRFDVPMAGLDTLMALIKAGGKAMALEADKMLMMDKDKVVKLADENDISIVAI